MFNKTDIEKYFNAEKAESLLFLGIGIIGIIAALVFLFVLKTQFYKGAAIPLALVGLLLGVVGYTVYARSDSDRIRNVYAYDMNPGELKEKEIPRMETVMKSFVIYRYTEISLAVIGLFLFIYFRQNADKQFWAGLGIGLLVMAILALGADYFAEKRGHVYIKGLQEFVNKH
jgi:cadmium resistance protein CadD (predicted permease)